MGSNFVLNILLARWLTPYEYGAFSLAFAAFLIVLSIYTATFLEPMLVFGAGKYKEQLPEYLGALVYGHLVFATLGSLALVATALGFALWGSGSLFAVFLSVALVEPFILLQWLMRRACYIRSEPRLAASGGVWYMVLMLAGAYVVYSYLWISTATALSVMGISSLAVSLWLAARLRVRLPSLRSGLIRETLKSHWEYGRWSVLNKELCWLPNKSYYLLLPLWAGLEANGAFKALMNLIMPMQQCVTSLTVLLLPFLVRAREQPKKFGSHVRLSLILLVLGSALYWLFIGIFHDQVVSLAYGYGGPYAEYANLLWILGLLPVAVAANEVFAQSLRALERPDALFRAYVLYVLIGGPLVVGFMYAWGIVGAVVGTVVSRVIAAALAAMVLWLTRWRSSAPSCEPELLARGELAREEPGGP
jgi:O-antigen/teichoic acid export membrane protein